MSNPRSRDERLADLARNMKYLYDHERRPHAANEMGWHHDLCGIQLSVMCQYREVQPIDFRSAEIMAIVEGEVKSLLGYIARAKSEPHRLRFGRILTDWQEANVWLPAMGDQLQKAFWSWGRPPYGKRWTT